MIARHHTPPLAYTVPYPATTVFSTKSLWAFGVTRWFSADFGFLTRLSMHACFPGAYGVEFFSRCVAFSLRHARSMGFLGGLVPFLHRMLLLFTHIVRRLFGKNG
jgi:hypothetical protein